MADDLDPVTQEFLADVEDYVAEVEAAAATAQEFAEANEDAKLAIEGLRDSSAEASAGLDDVAVSSAGAAAEADGLAEALGHLRDEALEAAGALHELRDSEVEAGGAGAAEGAGGMSMMAVAIVALIGLLAAVAPAVVAAGAGFGAFALFAVPYIQQVTGAIGDTKAQLGKLSWPIRQTVEEVRNLEAEWKSLSAQFTPIASNLASQGLGILSDLLPKLIPLAQAGAKAAGQLMDALGRGLDSKGFSDFLTMLEQLAGPGTNALIGLAGAIGGVLLDALEQLAPYSVPMIRMLQQLVAAAGPALTGALVFLAQALMDVGKAITPILGPLGKFFGYLDDHPVFAQIAAGILGIAVAVKVFQGVMSAVSALSNPWVLLAVAVALVAILIATHTHQIAEAFDVVRHSVADAGHEIAHTFDDIRHDTAQWTGDVRHDVASLGDDIIRPFQEAYDWIAGHWKDILVWLVLPLPAAVFEIRTHTHEIAQTFDDMRHDVSATLAGWRHDIANAVDDAMIDFDHFTEWLPHAIAEAFDAARHDAASALDGLRHDAASAYDGLRHDTAAVIDAVVGFFRRLPGQILGALAALPGMLYSAGVQAIRSLISGAGSMIGSAESTLKSWGHDLANAVVNPFGIHFSEPSEAAQMIKAGVNATRGLAAGMLSQVGSVRQASAAISAAAGLSGHGALGAAALGAGGAGYGGASPSVHVSMPVTLQGAAQLYNTPEFYHYLQNIVQEAVLRYGTNNPTNGLAFAAGRR